MDAPTEGIGQNKLTTMSNMKILDDTIFELEDLNIESRRKNPLVSIIILIVGVLLIVAAYNVGPIKESTNISSALIFIGFVVALAGFVMILACLFGKGRPFYNGKALKRYTFKHEQVMRERARDAVSKGDFKTLSEIPLGETSSILSVVYKPSNDEIAIAQTLEYIPHTYEPITEIAVFKKGEFTKADKFK